MAKRKTQSSRYDIVIVGNGLVGTLAAAVLGRNMKGSGLSLALVGPTKRTADKRTTAMLQDSIALMQRSGVWEEMRPHGAPLRTMRLIDASKRLVRSSEISFRASEIGEEAFGYNLPNMLALDALDAVISRETDVSLIDAEATGLENTGDTARISLSTGENVVGGLIVAADGRQSIIRDSANIGVREWSYPQTALVTTFTHSLPHRDISTELHTETGPMTQVPLPATKASPNRSSLVWVVKPHQADGFMPLEREKLAAIIAERFQGIFGRVELETDLQSFSLAGMSANKAAAGNVVLVGESAHVVPPIGAQGFNLGARDVETLAELVFEAAEDFDPHQIAQRYATSRQMDIVSRTAGVDLLNRSLLTDFLPVQLGRAGVIGAANRLTWFRNALMRTGMAGSPVESPMTALRQMLPSRERGRAAKSPS